MKKAVQNLLTPGQLQDGIEKSFVKKFSSSFMNLLS